MLCGCVLSGYQLFIVVGSEVPDVDGPTLISHDECGLVGMETHTGHRSIDLEQPLTLLVTTPALRMGVVYMYM